MITSRIFDPKYPEIKEYSLVSEKLIVNIINMGATITSVICRSDQTDVVLGYDTIDEYLRFDNYFGATIGRCANRIRNGRFDLNGKTYKLDINDACNALHGGKEGFHARLFTAEIQGDTLIMQYFSRDMEEGYPGNVSFRVSFTLCEDTLSVQYQAISDKDTIVNFTNHSYFALQGQGKGTVDHQLLRMQASRYAENDENRLVSGVIKETAGTPFDFTKEKAIGTDIGKKENEQIRYANGYDHYFLFNEQQEHRVEAYDLRSGHRLRITSDLPGFHFYVPDYKEAHTGKGNAQYKGHCAFCIETSFMPDAINLHDPCETLLKAQEVFTSVTTYSFQ